MYILELAISPTLNISLMPRNPNDGSSAGQSSSQQLNASGTETSSNQQSQSSLNQTEITIPSAEPTTVKADASQQVQASSMG
jgi:hypothetical protein